MDIKLLADKIQAETEKIIVGKSDKIRLVIMAILSDGHVLLDDLPGVGKTTLVKTISKALGCDFGRIQFVPDMLPSDIIGMNIFNQKTGDFELRKGPVCTNILLADEINRAIPRTQSALLEAMEEKQVSIEGNRIEMPKPFIVLATQNPVESESTFRLPAAQMDRFLIKLSIGYPSREEEKKMLENLGDKVPFENVEAVTSKEEIIKAQEEISKVKVSEKIEEYIVAIAEETRNDSRLAMGASPRATRGLYKASKAFAAMNGRDFVTPDDIKQIAQPVLAHRLMLVGSSRYSGISAETVLSNILEKVEVPTDIFEK